MGFPRNEQKQKKNGGGGRRDGGGGHGGGKGGMEAVPQLQADSERPLTQSNDPTDRTDLLL